MVATYSLLKGVFGYYLLVPAIKVVFGSKVTFSFHL